MFSLLEEPTAFYFDQIYTIKIFILIVIVHATAAVHVYRRIEPRALKRKTPRKRKRKTGRGK